MSLTEEEELMYNSEFMLILEQTRKEREAKQQGKKLERVLTAYASNMERDRFMYGEFERQSREITYLKVSLWALALLTALNFVLGVK